MTKFLYNDKILRDRRRDLRRNQTEAEKILWLYLSRKQISDLRFFRQYSIGPYILDFYCPAKRLAIEIDGKTHDAVDAKVYDQERTLFLRSADVKVIRFKNEKVVENAGVVLEEIKLVIDP